MKNKTIIAVSLAAVVAATAVIAGCSQKNKVVSTTTGSATATWNGGNGGQQMTKIDTPDLMGEVESISNGKVTLKVMEVKTDSSAGNKGNFQPVSGEMPSGSMPAMNSGAAPAMGSGTMPSAGSGTMPSGNGGGGNMGGGVQTEYTGEEKTITLTDDTKIVSMSMSSSSETELSLSDIKAGQTLYVYYESDGTTIDYVAVMDKSNSNADSNS